MFWYLEKERPIHQMLDIQKIVKADKWGEVSKEEKQKIATQVGAWEQASICSLLT